MGRIASKVRVPRLKRIDPDGTLLDAAMAMQLEDDVQRMQQGMALERFIKGSKEEWE